MKIGIIGTGNMGRSLGTAWARAGHSVLFGSRDITKAKSVAAVAGNAQAGDFDSAAEFGDVGAARAISVRRACAFNRGTLGRGRAEGSCR